MTNSHSIKHGLTIEQICPDISHSHLQQVAELLATRVLKSTTGTAEARRIKLATYPASDRATVRQYTNAVIAARSNP